MKIGLVASFSFQTVPETNSNIQNKYTHINSVILLQQQKIHKKRVQQLFMRSSSGARVLGNDRDLLSREEEVRILFQIKRQKDLNLLCDRISEEEGCSISVGQWAIAAGVDVMQLLHDLQLSQRAKSRLLTSHTVLVESVARKYSNTKSMSFDDLVQEGNIGLLTAVEKFDPDRGCRFSTFARWWITASILRAIQNKDQLIRLPVATHDRIRRIWTVRNQLRTELGYQPSEDEIAEALHMSISELRFYGEAIQTMSLEKLPTMTSQYTSIIEVQKDIVSSTTIHNILETVLSNDEALAVRLRFGLFGTEPQSFNEIGKSMHKSGEGIRKMITRALRKIQQTEFGLKNFNDFISFFEI